MRGFIGLCLLMTGLSIGAYSHYPGPQHREATLAELTQIVTGAIHQNSAPDASEAHPKSHHGIDVEPQVGAHHTVDTATTSHLPKVQRLVDGHWFAGSKTLARVTAAGASDAPSPTLKQPPRRITLADNRAKQVTGDAHQGIPAFQTATVKRPPPVASGWRTAVVRVEGARAENGHRLTSLKPKTDAQRWKLVKALQRELKRVGCYWGKIDGIWGKGSKWAMADFVKQVNSALPSEDPDFLLLQLVSSHEHRICGRTDNSVIAARSAPNSGNRQIAAAQSDRSRSYRLVTTGSQDTAGGLRRQAPLPGRMALGVRDQDARPQLLAPPSRITRQDRVLLDTQEAKPERRRLQISALPRQAPDAVFNTTGNVAVPDGTGGVDVTSESIRIEAERAAAEQQRRTLRKAAKANKRKRYRRRYRTRSVQSLFTNPLGFR